MRLADWWAMEAEVDAASNAAAAKAMNDAVARSRIGSCPSGPTPFIFTDDVLDRAGAMRSEGKTWTAIGSALGVNPASLCTTYNQKRPAHA